MSEAAGRPASVSSVSSVSSISLVDIKADTKLVLKAFLRHSLAVPPEDRPGRVGGGYRDGNKYRATVKPRQKVVSDSPDEDGSSADEKKLRFKDLVKRLPRPSTVRRPAKASGTDPSRNGSLGKDGQLNGVSLAHLSDKLEDDVISPSSTSEEEDGERKQEMKLRKKKKKLKTQISEFFKRRIEKEKDKDKEKEKEKEKDKEKEKQKEKEKEKEKEKQKEKEKEKDKERNESRPGRPGSLSINVGPEPARPHIVSPTHPPEFYEEVAERLERIAQKSHSIKRPSPRPPPTPPPVPSPDKPPPATDKEAVVRQLVQVLSTEGDAINVKIQSDPFLRATFSRLSYASFAKMLDTYSRREVADAPPMPIPASPTLRRVAVSMEATRRVVTATGTQRMQGYAERYMENFAPWVKSQGGWENIVQLDEASEYD